MPDDGLTSVDAVALRRFLDGENALVREHVRAVLSHPEFVKPPAPPPTDRYREQVMKRARRLAATGGPALLFPPEFGGLGRVGAAITSFETLAPRPDGVVGRVGDLLVTYPERLGRRPPPPDLVRRRERAARRRNRPHATPQSSGRLRPAPRLARARSAGAVAVARERPALIGPLGRG